MWLICDEEPACTHTGPHPEGEGYFSLELMELSGLPVGVPSLSAEKGLRSLKILGPCSQHL